MPRHLRIEYPGALYHVTIRGNAGRPVFLGDPDRTRFLEQVADAVETHGVRLYVFCLMNNHVHLVVETPHANLHRFMHGLETGYTVYFNKRHAAVGHLFQGRYKAKLVEGDAYLLNLSRYVHLNPVRGEEKEGWPLNRRLAFLRAYRWSSYRQYAGMERNMACVICGPVLALVAPGRRRQASAYRRFVESGLAENGDEFRELLQQSPVAIGGDAFQAWVHDRSADLARQAAKPEDVCFRPAVPHLQADEVLRQVASFMGVDTGAWRLRRRNSMVRPLAARMLLKYSGLTHRAVADLLDVSSGAAIGRQSRKLALVMQQDHTLAGLVRAIEQALVHAGRR